MSPPAERVGPRVAGSIGSGRSCSPARVASDNGATSPAGRHHPPPTTHPEERENTREAQARLAHIEAPATAYCRQDVPLEVRQCIGEDLDTGTSYEDFRRAVNECMEHIRKGPGGFSNQYVPAGADVFQQRQWRSPEAFAERWKARQNGHES